MAYSIGKATALKFFREHGVSDPTEFKLSDLAFGLGAHVIQKPLQFSDGRIVFFKAKALITINENISTKEKKRFVLAHELGHFFMHRDSFIIHMDSDETLHYFQKGVQEREANEFAAELLMPNKLFLECCRGQYFCPDLLRNLAKRFQVSISSAAHRFIEFGNHPIALIYSEGGIVKFFRTSDDFNNRLKNLFRISVPLGSVASEYFSSKKRYSKNESQQTIRKSTWCELRQDEFDSIMYEYCIPNSWNNSLISVIWEL